MAHFRRRRRAPHRPTAAQPYRRPGPPPPRPTCLVRRELPPAACARSLDTLGRAGGGVVVRLGVGSEAGTSPPKQRCGVLTLTRTRTLTTCCVKTCDCRHFSWPLCSGHVHPRMSQ